MPRLVTLDLPGGPAFVDALRRVWDAGDAAFPVDQRLSPASRRELAGRFGSAAVIDPSGEHLLTDAVPVEPGDALVVATSGSTGHPKGVVLTHAAVESSAVATSHRLGVTTDDHWLACLPLNHVGGLSVVTRAIHAGTRLTVLPRFDVEAVMTTDATHVSLVATALARIDPAHFRVIVLGGARPPDDRPSNCVTTYGMTETGSGVVYDGVPLDGVEVRVVAGELQLHGPMLLRCYRDGTDPRTADGWYPTGDLGTVGDDGEVTVLGRSDDLIITGGENVWPDSVERAIGDVPGVVELAVSGTPDPEWGEIVTVHLVMADGTPPVGLDELRDRVRSVLPAFCAPRRVVVHDALPRTSLGKVRRQLLSTRPDSSPT